MKAAGRVTFAAMLLSVHIGTATAQPVDGASSIVGTWEIVEITTPNRPDVVRHAPPGIVIFTRSHYSITRVVLDGPRPLVDRSSASTAPVAPLRALLQFVGEAGLYERTPDEIVLHRILSLFPKDELPDNVAVFSYRCDSRTLWLTNRTGALGPVGLTLTLVRLE